MTKKIWTIGHSTHSIHDFLTLLQAHGIEQVADIRRFPGSRRYPQFGKEALQQSLSNVGIQYEHLEALGGRRAPKPDSRNSGWRVPAFRGYADYMETDVFKEAAAGLERLASVQRTAYLCSEAVWWSCHRALVSDYLKARGWDVFHILSPIKADEHPWTKPARLVDGHLSYAPEGSIAF